MDVADTQLYSQTGPQCDLPGAGAGVYRHLEPVQQHHQRTCARAALLLDITGVVVDKPSASSKLGVIGRQLFGASSDRLQENSLFDIVQTIRQAKDDRNITGIVLDLKKLRRWRPAIHAVHRQSAARIPR